MKKLGILLVCLGGLHSLALNKTEAAANVYGFVVGEKYVYDVQIQFGLGSDASIRKGLITYAASKAGKNEFTLKQSGTLRLTVGRGMSRGGFMRFGSTAVTCRFSRNGDELERKGSDVSRSVLADLPTLIVLPLKDKGSWSTKNGIDLSYTTEGQRVAWGAYRVVPPAV